MKPIHVLVITSVVVFAVLVCGCTQVQNAAPVTPAPSPVVSPAAASPAPTTNPYPDAKPMRVPVAFGSGDMTGAATVTTYIVKPTYTWTSPSWRSAREQAAHAPPNEVQYGYNTETPARGNTFLFVYFRVENTGTTAIVAPSPNQVVVSGDGKTYSYRPVADSGVVIDGITGTQYDYQLGKGGTGGYVQPGAGNAAEGYLIYEVPADIVPDRAFVLANLDYKTSAQWKLA